MPRASKPSFFGLPIIVGTAILALSMTVSAGSRAAFVGTNDNSGNSFSTASCFNAQPDGVQNGTTTSSANGVVSVPITAVDPSLSFLMFSSRHDSNRPVGSMIGSPKNDGLLARGMNMDTTRGSSLRYG